MSEIKLTETFKNICKTYFPLFDKKKRWKVRYSSTILGDGFCDDKKKLIFIANFNNEMMLQLLLIHEICHAISSSGHDKKWKTRMSKASERATRIGQKELSQMIKNDIRMYNLSVQENAQMVYDSIESCLVDSPQASFATVIKYVAGTYGLFPEEFKRKYKRSRQIYNKLKKTFREKKSNIIISL